MRIRTIGWLLVSVLLFITGSCTPTEEAQKPDSQKEVEPKKEITLRPSWFIETNRKTTDSLSVFGYGMAVSYDSAESANRAVDQAEIRFKNTVGDSLEKIRKSLLESDSGQSNGLDDPSFLIDLRNAVSDLPSIADIADSEIRSQKSRYVGFARVVADWSVIKQHLKDQLSEYPDFLEAL